MLICYHNNCIVIYVLRNDDIFILSLLSAHFRKVIERANQEPVKKYPFPQTEAQEYGWISTPLVRL